MKFKKLFCMTSLFVSVLAETFTSVSAKEVSEIQKATEYNCYKVKVQNGNTCVGTTLQNLLGYYTPEVEVKADELQKTIYDKAGEIFNTGIYNKIELYDGVLNCYFDSIKFYLKDNNIKYISKEVEKSNILDVLDEGYQLITAVDSDNFYYNKKDMNSFHMITVIGADEEYFQIMDTNYNYVIEVSQEKLYDCLLSDEFFAIKDIEVEVK